MNKTLVCFFSATGTTKSVAQKFARATDADLFEIVPKKEYREKDLDWTNKRSRTSKEAKNVLARPKIKSKINNLSNYNKIVLAFPVWWYTAPRIINSFIEKNDLSSKEIYIFVTSGSSSADKSFDDLKTLYPKLNFVRAVKFTGYEGDPEYIDFIS